MNRRLDVTSIVDCDDDDDEHPMNRTLDIESVEGEIALVIDYQPGESEAISVLTGAMQLIGSLDRLDHCLLSSIDSDLEPVSILNDVQHSSLKILLARVIRHIPDDVISNLEWKKWLGALLVKGKHRLLSSNDTEIPQVLASLEDDYKNAPNTTAGYAPPSLTDTRAALRQVATARASLTAGKVTVQTELGDILLPLTPTEALPIEPPSPISTNVLKDQVLLIKAAAFEGKRQWQFSDGSTSFGATISDEAFLQRVERGEHFGKGDSLVVDYSMTQTLCNGKLSTHREIVVVKRHMNRHQQLILI